MMMFDNQLFKTVNMTILSFSLKFVFLISFFFRVNLHIRLSMFVQKMFLKDIGEKRRIFAIQVSKYISLYFNNEKKKKLLLLLFIFRYTLQSLIGKHHCRIIKNENRMYMIIDHISK